jgi:hypothetical protein
MPLTESPIFLRENPKKKAQFACFPVFERYNQVRENPSLRIRALRS